MSSTTFASNVTPPAMLPTDLGNISTATDSTVATFTVTSSVAVTTTTRVSTTTVLATGELLAEISSEQHATNIAVVAVLAVVIVIGLLGNSLVLAAYRPRSGIAAVSPAVVFILAMAALDVASCLLSLPYEILDLLRPYDNDNVLLCRTFRFLTTICLPLTTYTFSHARWVVVGVILLTVTLNWPQVVLNGKVTIATHVPGVFGTDCNIMPDIPAVYSLLYHGVMYAIFAVSFTAYGVLYGRIFYVLWRKGWFDNPRPPAKRQSKKALVDSSTSSDSPRPGSRSVLELRRMGASDCGSPVNERKDIHCAKPVKEAQKVPQILYESPTGSKFDEEMSQRSHNQVSAVGESSSNAMTSPSDLRVKCGYTEKYPDSVTLTPQSLQPPERAVFSTNLDITYMGIDTQDVVTKLMLGGMNTNDLNEAFCAGKRSDFHETDTDAYVDFIVKDAEVCLEEKSSSETNEGSSRKSLHQTQDETNPSLISEDNGDHTTKDKAARTQSDHVTSENSVHHSLTDSTIQTPRDHVISENNVHYPTTDSVVQTSCDHAMNQTNVHHPKRDSAFQTKTSCDHAAIIPTTSLFLMKSCSNDEVAGLKGLNGTVREIREIRSDVSDDRKQQYLDTVKHDSNSQATQKQVSGRRTDGVILNGLCGHPLKAAEGREYPVKRTDAHGLDAVAGPNSAPCGQEKLNFRNSANRTWGRSGNPKLAMSASGSNHFGSPSAFRKSPSADKNAQSGQKYKKNNLEVGVRNSPIPSRKSTNASSNLPLGGDLDAYQIRRHGGKRLRMGKTTLMLSIVTLGAFLGYVPFLTVIVMKTSGARFQDVTSSTGDLVYMICIRSFVIHNVINPFVYFYVNPRFREKVYRVLRCVCRCLLRKKHG
ncbi:hypothetical protein BaRGS_00039919, partial [Batillaria attramentaria]